MLKILRAKFHGIRVTASDLNYHGSITLDPVQCARAGILPLEFVEVWNKNSGQRLTTYVIYGEPGSRCCVLNGAAARTCQTGDELIICASEYVADARELAGKSPVVLCFGEDNEVTDCLRYEVGEAGPGRMGFAVRRAE